MAKNHMGTDKIEEEIRATRESIDDKVERLQQQFSPGDMVDSIIGFARSNGGAIAGGIGRTVREHPLPVAMIGAGVVWLALSSRADHHEIEEEGDYSDDSGETAATRLRHRTEAVRERARERAEEAREEIEELGHRAKVRAARAGRNSGRFVKEHPVLVGAAGLALGAALAASLPRTRHEDDTFGERATRAKASARRAAAKEGRKVKEAAKAAARKAPTPDDLKRDVEHVAESSSRH